MKENREAKQTDEQTDYAWRAVDDAMMWKMPPVKWEWRFIGDSKAIVIRLADDVSWWKRFWTRVFFGSTWTRVPQVKIVED